jgi:hypothetical protein
VRLKSKNEQQEQNQDQDPPKPVILIEAWPKKTAHLDTSLIYTVLTIHFISQA